MHDERSHDIEYAKKITSQLIKRNYPNKWKSNGRKLHNERRYNKNSINKMESMEKDIKKQNIISFL